MFRNGMNFNRQQAEAAETKKDQNLRRLSYLRRLLAAKREELGGRMPAVVIRGE